MSRMHIGLASAMLLLVTNQPVFGQPSFQGNWESGTVTGLGNTNWMSLQAVASDRFTLVNDGVRPGTYARVEVRNGDNPFASCCFDTDRAEVVHMQNADNTKLLENLSSGTQQYSFSVKFDDSWQTIVEHGNGAWGIFLQLHAPDALGTTPALALSATDEIRLNMHVGDVAASMTVQHELLNGTLNIGHWIDFALTVKYAADDSGFVNLMRRDEGEIDFREVLNIVDTPTLQYNPGLSDGAVLDHYWKHGLYRNRQDFTSILYLDGLTREVAPVPEPGTYVLMLIGLLAVIGVVRGRKGLGLPEAPGRPGSLTI